MTFDIYCDKFLKILFIYKKQKYPYDYKIYMYHLSFVENLYGKKFLMYIKIYITK